MKDAITVTDMMAELGQKAKAASVEMAAMPSEKKLQGLNAAADAVWAAKDDILSANAQDLEYGRSKGLTDAMMDRLMLDEDRIAAMVQGIRDVAALGDPVGAVMAEWDRPTGLHIKRVRTPLGVIGVIYESRPNVTADAAALCVQAGNAVILRGGSESFHSATAIHAAMVQGLASAGLPADAIQLVPTRDRDAVGEMLSMVGVIDVIVPRGGKGLVGRVQQDARVPVFAHLEGICHIYVDQSADPEKTQAVVINAKTRRTGICGAAECLLIDKTYYEQHGAPFIDDLIAAGVEVRGDETLQKKDGVVPATDDDWGKEYLDMIIAARVVDGVDGAIAHLRDYSSQHTDCIMAEDESAVAEFFARVDSAILMHNASTQFADGGEFGMGAEIGIATGKMHARGPVGVEQLTSFKYLVTGQGTTRA